MKLDKRVYKYIEYELYNYNNSKEDIEEMKKQIIETSGFNDGQPKGNETISTTENKVIKIISSTAINNTQRILKAIDETLYELGGTYRRFFDMRYIKKEGIVKICNEMPISERSFYNYKDKLVYAVAQKLGLEK